MGIAFTWEETKGIPWGIMGIYPLPRPEERNFTDKFLLNKSTLKIAIYGRALSLPLKDFVQFQMSRNCFICDKWNIAHLKVCDFLLRPG